MSGPGEQVREKLQSVSLEDKWELERGQFVITGKQALARLPIIQKQLDAGNGLNTAGFVSGYPGSPLANYDLELTRISHRLAANDIFFLPGVNEDMAATSIWGTQQAALFSKRKFDGVFGIWYGKGPGFDRSGDAFKHANLAGTDRNGGVLLLVGDDHPGKSSGAAFQTDLSLAATGIPVLYPSSVLEYIEYGIHGIALSRYSGLYVAIKCVNETVDSTAVVEFDQADVQSKIPSDELSEPDRNIRLELLAVGEQDKRLVRQKLPAVAKYLRANELDRVTVGLEMPSTLAIVTAGKSFGDVRGALELLGIEETTARELGIGVLKLACVFPIEPRKIERFAANARELLVVEEKRAQIEPQIAQLLYNRPDRPVLTGKLDESGKPLLAADEPLNCVSVAQVLAARLEKNIEDIHSRSPPVSSALPGLRAVSQNNIRLGPLLRKVNYCSGCPHNTSTVAPEGGVVLTGVGCHSIVQMLDRTHVPVTQMGGEGANWIGIEPFVDGAHAYANMGDGTYNHSGSLAIRAAVQAGSDMTFRLLYNGTIAMTGGQSINNGPSVQDVTSQLLAEQVSRIHIVSDQPQSLKSIAETSDQVELYHRDELPLVHKKCQDARGVSVVLYVQQCTNEKRKLRKRGKLPKPTRRIFINDLVCEGCGDCSTQSNCMSIFPLETEFGRKRTIDQSSCNVDYSCLRGFCPSFVSVEGVELRTRKASLDLFELAEHIEAPPRAGIPGTTFSILIAGVGGTGVVTTGALLVMAARLDNLGANTYDMTGLAQKGGAVYSHLRVFKQANEIWPYRIESSQADVVIGSDLVAATQYEAVQTINEKTTRAVLDTFVYPTSEFHQRRDLDLSSGPFLSVYEELLPEKSLFRLDASLLAREFFAEPTAANIIMLGFALQEGLLPVSISAIERAIEINGVAIQRNKKALALGRVLSAFPEKISSARAELERPEEWRRSDSIAEAMERRTADLRAYQDSDYAVRYVSACNDAIAADKMLPDEQNEFALAVVRNAYKVMAIKDEYEIGRLFSDGRFEERLKQQFAGNPKITFHMSPPGIAPMDKATGRPTKMNFSSWMKFPLRFFWKLRWLRGRKFDPFGRTEERKLERRLRDSYLNLMSIISRNLSQNDYPQAVQLAQIPDTVRGFGFFKEKEMQEAIRTIVKKSNEWPGRKESGKDPSGSQAETATTTLTVEADEQSTLLEKSRSYREGNDLLAGEK